MTKIILYVPFFVMLFLLSCNTIEIKEDRELAFLKEKALSGDVRYQIKLGDMYYKGESVTVDYEESYRWWKMAADSGNYLAEYVLANYYLEGIGVEKDATVAVKYFLLSAEQNYAHAQSSLALSYLQGEGVPEDCETGLMWMIIAIHNGKVLYKDFMERYKKILPVVYDRAELRANQWLEQHKKTND